MTDTPQNAPEGSTESESHVDQAMLGPTPDNPSLSLKKLAAEGKGFSSLQASKA